MVRLKGPLFSLEASGTVAGVLTYQHRQHSGHGRYQKPQKDYINEARLTQRTKFWVAVQEWKSLSAGEKRNWHELGMVEG